MSATRAAENESQGKAQHQRPAPLPAAWQSWFDAGRGLPRLCVIDFDMTCTKNDSTLAIAPPGSDGQKLIEDSSESADNLYALTDSMASLMAGETRDTLEARAKANIELSDSLPELVSFLRSQGCKVVVMSGGFAPAVSIVRQNPLNIDVVICNELDYRPNPAATGEQQEESGWVIKSDERDSKKSFGDTSPIATGKLAHAPCVNAESKGLLIAALQSALDLQSCDTMVIGDSANDVSMFKRALFKVGMQPKPILADECDVKLKEHDFAPLIKMLTPFTRTRHPCEKARQSDSDSTSCGEETQQSDDSGSE